MKTEDIKVGTFVKNSGEIGMVTGTDSKRNRYQVETIGMVQDGDDVFISKSTMVWAGQCFEDCVPSSESEFLQAKNMVTKLSQDMWKILATK